MSQSHAPRRARTDDEIQRCFEVMAQLRPQLEADRFVSLVRELETEGFRLAFIEDHGRVVAVAGYRVSTNLFLGRNLYVDDLVTAADARSAGHGAALLEWLRDQARAEDCTHLHLDSGTQRHRAHAFYLRHGMHIGSFHFLQRLGS
ncbi:MAG: GNAT family N-acetyltransferase [Xanthomonadales bacterium]|nr:GNAT family N-acetyltransferase [Xanthomonadales bacterium]